MRRFLGVMSLGSVLALIGCGPASDPMPPPAGPGATETVAGGPTPTPTATSEPIVAPSPTAPAGPGALTPENTKIEFVGTKKDGRHTGGFTTFSGSITPIDGDFTAARITIDIDTDSLDSDNPKLTGHLKGPDFFDVRKFPKATFVSTGIKEGGADGASHTITGDLTLHGTTKTITIPAKVMLTDDTLTLDGTFTIDRLEYGISYQPDAVNPTVTITVAAKVARK